MLTSAPGPVALCLVGSYVILAEGTVRLLFMALQQVEVASWGKSSVENDSQRSGLFCLATTSCFHKTRFIKEIFILKSQLVNNVTHA